MEKKRKKKWWIYAVIHKVGRAGETRKSLAAEIDLYCVPNKGRGTT